MTKKNDLRLRLVYKTVALTMLSILITPPIYDLLSFAVIVTYTHFWTVFISVGGGLATRWLINSSLKDFKTLRKPKRRRWIRGRG